MRIPQSILDGLAKLVKDLQAYINKQSALNDIFPRPNHTEPVKALLMNKELKKKIEDLCLAIRDYEGKPGDRNYRNNNPGNARYSKVGYLPIYQPVLKDKDGFAIFKNYQIGWMYLVNLIKHRRKQYPEWTIIDLMESYAPKSDGNNPTVYASYIAKRLGISVKTKLKDFV